MSWLSRAIDKMDRSRARSSRVEPDRLILPPRGEAIARLSCMSCWQVHLTTNPERARATTCSECGGRLVLVVS